MTLASRQDSQLVMFRVLELLDKLQKKGTSVVFKLEYLILENIKHVIRFRSHDSF